MIRSLKLELVYELLHRLGHKGKVDVKLKPGTGRGTAGGGCYPDHLPVLMHVPEEANHAAAGMSAIPGELLGNLDVIFYVIRA